MRARVRAGKGDGARRTVDRLLVGLVLDGADGDVHDGAAGRVHALPDAERAAEVGLGDDERDDGRERDGVGRERDRAEDRPAGPERAGQRRWDC